VGSVAGKTVVTIEGLSPTSSHPLQKAWVVEEVPQCGYCQSRQIMKAAEAATDEQIFPEGGGLQIRDAAGEVIGAVGVTGDTEERDEELAAHGIRAIGLKTDEDCAAMGRRSGIRLTNR
jgi:[2Fe-2S] binding domain/Haem-degrading